MESLWCVLHDGLLYSTNARLNRIGGGPGVELLAASDLAISHVDLGAPSAQGMQPDGLAHPRTYTSAWE